MVRGVNGSAEDDKSGVQVWFAVMREKTETFPFLKNDISVYESAK